MIWILPLCLEGVQRDVCKEKTELQMQADIFHTLVHS